jgi:hypothetical protein
LRRFTLTSLDAAEEGHRWSSPLIQQHTALRRILSGLASNRGAEFFGLNAMDGAIAPGRRSFYLLNNSLWVLLLRSSFERHPSVRAVNEDEYHGDRPSTRVFRNHCISQALQANQG